MTINKTVTAERISQAGGPKHTTVAYRLQHGYYPGSRIVNGAWRVPMEIAVQIVTDAKIAKDCIPLRTAAKACGLGPSSFNHKARSGTISALHIGDRWYVTKVELYRLQCYYLNTVPPEEAAKMLGYESSFPIRKLIHSGGLIANKINGHYRIPIVEIEQLLAERKKKLKGMML